VLSGGVLSTVFIPDTEEVAGSIPVPPTSTKRASEQWKRAAEALFAQACRSSDVHESLSDLDSAIVQVQAVPLEADWIARCGVFRLRVPPLSSAGSMALLCPTRDTEHIVAGTRGTTLRINSESPPSSGTLPKAGGRGHGCGT